MFNFVFLLFILPIILLIIMVYSWYVMKDKRDE